MFNNNREFMILMNKLKYSVYLNNFKKKIKISLVEIQIYKIKNQMILQMI